MATTNRESPVTPTPAYPCRVICRINFLRRRSIKETQVFRVFLFNWRDHSLRAEQKRREFARRMLDAARRE